MKRIIVQIYEIQDPVEAENMIGLGVDHVGSVILSEADWKNTVIRETIERVRTSAAKSSLIPLFHAQDSVFRALDYYRPDIVHFCEALMDQKDVWAYCRELIRLQTNVKKRFPQIRIMRSIPIVPAGIRNSVPTLEIGRQFEPISDFFLTDTLRVHDSGSDHGRKPVQGFVGITGERCDWDVAAQLVESSRIPVILAGGISPRNAAEGLFRVRPAGVDSCTRTNALDAAGRPVRFKKDRDLVRRLIEAVRTVEKEQADSESQDP